MWYFLAKEAKEANSAKDSKAQTLGTLAKPTKDEAQDWRSLGFKGKGKAEDAQF